jgi:WSC domain
MKQIPVLLFAAVTGYIGSAAAVDASLYGCYRDKGSLVLKMTDDFMSMGKCREACVGNENPGFSVQAMTNGTACLCGNTLPNKAFRVDDGVKDNTKCKQICSGYGTESCKSSPGFLLIPLV